MREEKYLTQSGYYITTQIINNNLNHIIVRDTNLYPDSDNRSKENREWLIPINNLDDLQNIGNLIMELCKQKKKR